MVEDPADHPFSGHREILGRVEPRLCDVASALLAFDGDPSTALVVYQDCLRAVAESRWARRGVRDLPWWRTVQDDDETVSPDNAPAQAQDFAQQPLQPEEPSRPPLRTVLRLFEHHLGVPPNQLAGRRRHRQTSWYRQLFVTFSVSWLGFAAKEVAEVLDKASGSVSRWLSEGLLRQQSEPSFRSCLDELAARCDLEWPGTFPDESPEDATPVS
jgi:hypothetical protein